MPNKYVHTMSFPRVADNPYCNCNHNQGAYETAAHFVDECDRYASLRLEMWAKPYLHADNFHI